MADKAKLAKFLAYNCVRNNTPLEDLHALGRISDEEMKELMIGVTDALYTALIDLRFFHDSVPAYWEEPKHLEQRWEEENAIRTA